MNIFSIIVIAGFTQGMSLVVALNTMKKGDAAAKKYLSYIIIVITLLLAGRFFYSYSQMTPLLYKVLYLGDLVIFLYGPLLYFFFLKLFKTKLEKNYPIYVHFIPAVLYMFLILPIYFYEGYGFVEYIKKYDAVFNLAEVLAIAQNLLYLYLNYNLTKEISKRSKEQASFIPKVSFFQVMLKFSFGCIIFWILSIFDRYVHFIPVEDFLGYQLVWVTLSFFVFVIGIYTLANPEIFDEIELIISSENSADSIENLDQHVVTINSVMAEQKPFLQPKLTLADLSELTGISRHVLSKILNDVYEKNFFEFVNNYRIDEFKYILDQSDSKLKTHSAIALEAGFNSKSTFYTAFKKITGYTPKEYLKQRNAKQS